MRKPWIVLLFLLPFSISAQTDYKKGVHLFEQKKYESAKRAFQTYLDEKPNDAGAKEHLGDIAAYQGNWDTAVKYYKELVEEYPDNAKYSFEYGGTLGLKAMHISRVKALFYVSDIKKYLKKAAELDPSHVETRWALVELYIQLPGILGGSVSTAQKYANQLLEISPLNGYLAKGRIAAYEDNRTEMLKYYKKALGFGNGEACAATLSALAKSDPSFPTVNFNDNTCKTYKGNYMNYQIGKIAADSNLQNERGIFYMQRYIDNYSAIDGVPIEWGYLRMANLYQNLANQEKALFWVKKALKTKPDFEEAKKLEENIVNH